MKKQQGILKIIIVLSILGIVLSGFLISLHYSEDKSICDINKILNCSKVGASKYSTLLGVPIAVLGTFGYFLLVIISLKIYIRKNWEKKQKRTIKKILFKNIIRQIIKTIFSSEFLLFFSLLALAFSLYLTFAETFIIKAFCIFCLFSQGIILSIAILSTWYFCLNKKIKLKR
jgi:vitamin-K-epoxide reductase (warfarin-sensitive)